MGLRDHVIQQLMQQLNLLLALVSPSVLIMAIFLSISSLFVRWIAKLVVLFLFNEIEV